MLEVTLEVNDAAFEQTVSLDGLTYGFEFWWNERMESWYMTVYTALGEPITSGIRLAHKQHLLAKYRDERLPPGSLFLISLSDSPCDPTFEGFGVDTKLVYYTADDLASIVVPEDDEPLKVNGVP